MLARVQNIDISAFFSVGLHLLLFAGVFNVFGFAQEEIEFRDFSVISASYEEDLAQNQEVLARNGENLTRKAEKKMKKSTSSQKFAQQLGTYADLIAAELERRKSRFSMNLAPDDAKGVVVFRVKIDENGNLVDFRVAQGSGHEFFDRIAEKILTCEKHFPKPPVEIAKGGVELVVPMRFVG